MLIENSIPAPYAVSIVHIIVLYDIPTDLHRVTDNNEIVARDKLNFTPRDRITFTEIRDIKRCYLHERTFVSFPRTRDAASPVRSSAGPAAEDLGRAARHL